MSTENLSAARLLIHSPQRPADLKKTPPSTKEASAHPPSHLRAEIASNQTYYNIIVVDYSD